MTLTASDQTRRHMNQSFDKPAVTARWKRRHLSTEWNDLVAKLHYYTLQSSRGCLRSFEANEMFKKSWLHLVVYDADSKDNGVFHLEHKQTTESIVASQARWFRWLGVLKKRIRSRSEQKETKLAIPAQQVVVRYKSKRINRLICFSWDEQTKSPNPFERRKNIIRNTQYD